MLLGTWTLRVRLWASFWALQLGFGVPYLNTLLSKEPLRNKSLYFFLPGNLKAQTRLYKGSASFLQGLFWVLERL